MEAGDRSETQLERLKRQRRSWERKASLRVLYRHWYARVTAELSPDGPVMELGCGCGNFKEFYPEVIATDFLKTPWCDQVLDACAIPYRNASLKNLVLFDVLHHLPRPLDFFSEALRVLQPGGRIILVEPYLTTWSRFIYGFFHHEDFDLSADLFDPPEKGGDSLREYANEATANIIFDGRLDDFRERFPEFRVIKLQPFSFMVYPLIGGFGAFSALPAFTVLPLSRLEEALFKPFYKKSAAMRLMIVLEKTG